MFQCFTFHLSKFNVSIFHLQSAIRLFQRTGRLGHASLSCMHESVIPLEHKQHSTQTLKYVDKNFCVWSNFLCKVDICRLIRLIERGSLEHRSRPRQVPSSSASLLYCHRDQRQRSCADRIIDVVRVEKPTIGRRCTRWSAACGIYGTSTSSPSWTTSCWRPGKPTSPAVAHGIEGTRR